MGKWQTPSEQEALTPGSPSLFRQVFGFLHLRKAASHDLAVLVHGMNGLNRRLVQHVVQQLLNSKGHVCSLT